MRRAIGLIAMLSLTSMLASGLSVSNKVNQVQFVFRRGNGTGTIIDTTDDGRINGYPDGEDTTGNGLYLTYSFADSSGYWYANVAETDVYDFYIQHGAGTCSTLTTYQNKLIWATDVGDTMIADSAAFASNVINRAALRDDVIGADELDNTANFTGHRFTASQVLGDTLGDSALGYIQMIADVVGFTATKIAVDSIVANDSSAITIAITSTNITNGTIVDADVNASAAIALSKLATAGTVQADEIKTDTLRVKGDDYIYRDAPWKIPATMAVLDTFIHYSANSKGTDCVGHTIGFPGANVGDWFWWRFEPGLHPPRAIASGPTFSFAICCTTADSVTVQPNESSAGVPDYAAGDSTIAIIRFGDWLGD